MVSYPQNTIDTMLNSLDTHDIVRALTMLNGQYMRSDYRDIWKWMKILLHGTIIRRQEEYLTQKDSEGLNMKR